MSSISNKSSLSSSTQTSSSENLLTSSKTAQITFLWTQSSSLPPPSSVYLTGSFCKWKQKFTMHFNPKTLSHELTLPLPKGVFFFKFIVDDKWEIHSSYKSISDNGFINNYIDTSIYFNKANELFRNKRMITCPECYCAMTQLGKKVLNHVQHCHCLLRWRNVKGESLWNVCATQRVRNKNVIVVYYKRNECHSKE